MKTTKQTAKAVATPAMTKAEELSAIHIELLAIASDTVTGQALTSKAAGTLIDRFKRSTTLHANDSEAFSKWAVSEEARIFDALLSNGTERKAAQGGVSSYRRNRVALSYFIEHTDEVLKLDDHIRLQTCKEGTCTIAATLETISIARIERARKVLEANSNSIAQAKAAIDAKVKEKEQEKEQGKGDLVDATTDPQAPVLPMTLRSEVKRLISEFGIDKLEDEVAIASKALREAADKAAKVATA